MIDKPGKPANIFTDYINNYRKLVWASIAIVVYAALGFFVTPWLVQKKSHKLNS